MAAMFNGTIKLQKSVKTLKYVFVASVRQEVYRKLLGYWSEYLLLLYSSVSQQADRDPLLGRQNLYCFVANH